MTARPGHAGTGPGAMTPDGCAVDLYAHRLPTHADVGVVADVAPPGARLLELGCGAGRMTHPLLQQGFRVTAVDESAEMLEHVRGARTVHTAIEDLDLGETFDVVLLASFLVHAADPALRAALLATCRRHVADGGMVLVQREGEGWHDDLPLESPIRGTDGTVRTVSSDPVGDGVRRVLVEYRFPDATWTQTFLSRPLTPAEFETLLGAAGLELEAYLTDDGVWALARPVGDTGA